MIAQTIQFSGLRPETLYEECLSSEQHSAMTAGALHATFLRDGQQVADGSEGDELRAFGTVRQGGQIDYSLGAHVLRLVPGRLILMSWKNKAWNMAVDPGEIGPLRDIVNTHWSLLYWEPMRTYFQQPNTA